MFCSLSLIKCFGKRSKIVGQINPFNTFFWVDAQFLPNFTLLQFFVCCQPQFRSEVLGNSLASEERGCVITQPPYRRMNCLMRTSLR